jgi:hypothetical protein
LHIYTALHAVAEANSVAIAATDLHLPTLCIQPKEFVMSQPSRPNTLARRQWLLATTSIAAAALLAACGGGGSDTPTTPAAPETTAATFTSGAITGFGSIIVGGVRFDDSNATVVDEDGGRRERSELRLGAQVEIDAGNINRAEARAVAMRIALGGSLKGPVSTVDAANSSFTLLGATILVTTSTMFDAALAGGISAITPGSTLEVYGLFDRVNNRFVATRVAPEDTPTEYRLRGIVSQLDTTAKTFRIGSELINYAGVPASDVPRTLANGQFVRVRLQTTQVNGAWVANNLRHGVRPLEARPEARVEGVITAFTSTAAFEVNGIVVDAANASFPDGTAGIALGARVEVSGAAVNGVLVATKVEVEERRDRGQRPLEFHGEMGNLDTTAKTFALRGLTVSYGPNTEYRDGTEATLANGRRVEVRGVISADRTRVEARRIEFK